MDELPGTVTRYLERPGQYKCEHCKRRFLSIKNRKGNIADCPKCGRRTALNLAEQVGGHE